MVDLRPKKLLEKKVAPNFTQAQRESVRRFNVGVRRKNIESGATQAQAKTEQKRQAEAKTEQKRQAEAKRMAEQQARETAQKEAQRQKVIQEKRNRIKARVTQIKQNTSPTFNQRQRLRALEIQDRRLQKQDSTPISTGTFTRVETPKKKSDRLIQNLNSLQGVASTESIRSRQNNIKNELALLGLTVGTTVISGVKSLIALPSTLVNVARNPSLLLKVPGAIEKGGAEFGQLIQTSPTEAFGKIGGEIVFLKGAGTTFKVVGKVGGRASTRLNPKFRGIKKSQINIKTGDTTTTIRVGGTVKKISEPLSKQARLSGKRVTAVSAQADRLVNFIRNKKVVRKPIPGEADFSPGVKNLLKKFDSGTINKKELITLESKVPVLERSFFADPRGRFRPSRLGITKQKDASILDLLSGDFTFKASKPQILIFKDVKVAKFPKNLKDVELALKTGKTLSESQGKRLLRFQTKKTGQFKPIGALTKEPEITLASGEIIKRQKKAGVTLVNGKKVDIVFAKVVKSSKPTSTLLKKAKSGKITSQELKALRKNLKKESGFTPRVSRSKKLKPRARLPKRVPGRPRRPSRVPRRIPRPPTRPTPIRDRGGRFVKRTTRPPTRARQPTRPPTRARPPTRGRPPTRPPTRLRVPPKAPPRLIPRLKKRRRSKRVVKKTRGYNVFAKPIKTIQGKKAKRGIKVNKVALTKRRAKDLRNFVTDTSLSRTSSIRPTRARPQKPKLKAPRGYAKQTNFKFRNYRIRKGKRIPLKSGKVIERRTRLLDTRQERRQITLRQRIKQITPRRRVKRRRMTTRKPSRNSRVKSRGSVSRRRRR